MNENGLCIKCETNEQRMVNMIKELSEPKEFYISERTGYQYEGYNRTARRRQKKSRK